MITLLVISIMIIGYAYLGYPLLLLALNKMSRKNIEEVTLSPSELPEITVVVPAYNEEQYLDEKIKNTLKLDYPKSKLKVIVITDGSDDGSTKLLKDRKDILHLHEPERGGKLSAMKRAISYVKSPITVFTDANALVNKEALLIIANKFMNTDVGVVAGEKRIKTGRNLNGSTSGESTYWKYESWMKKLNSEFNSTIGAVGELFAIRTELFEVKTKAYILDDFMLSLNANIKGYKTIYAPDAYALELASSDLKEEYKRKVRIAAGGWQSILDLFSRKEMFKQPKLIFQLLSRRVIRWMLSPILLPVIFLLNILLVNTHWTLDILLVCQIAFYTFSMVGFWLSRNEDMHPLFKIPFYFTFMHLAAFAGMIRYFSGKQSVLWDKVNRINPEVALTMD